LRGEGFTDFRYVPAGAYPSGSAVIADDDADFALDFATALVVAVDAGVRVKGLGGIHAGCYELFAHEDINSILDLKGKSVGVGPALGSDPHLFVSAMATYVGLDPVHDIKWIVSDIAPMQLFAERKIDALLAVSQEVQEMRAQKLGHVVVSGILDRPWSQYFCCILVARAEYVERYPVATKRVLRAVLKGADVCASNPEMVARKMIDGKHADNYEYVAGMLAELSYARWREFDPEDSVRFFSLRLHEAGAIKSSPQEIIASGTDWRFLNELKRELKT
jgi:NitT/TauT family transport system substrate-binding protein